MIALGNPSDLALASVLLSCIGFHLSRPRGVGIPIRVNSRATPEDDSTPASLVSTNQNIRSWPTSVRRIVENHTWCIAVYRRKAVDQTCLFGHCPRNQVWTAPPDQQVSEFTELKQSNPSFSWLRDRYVPALRLLTHNVD